jgi:cbb3-type cytochrome oxidase subunit 3
LSTAAKVGLGFGIGVVALAVFAAIGWFVLRARRAKQANTAAAAGMQQQQHPWELDSHEVMAPAELPAKGVS